jgi:hypothetical protein
LRASGIAVVRAMARTNRVKELRPLMPKGLDALRIVKAGEVVSVGASVDGKPRRSASPPVIHIGRVDLP